MREIEYKNFSLRTHRANWRSKRNSVCQFELSFKCDLHCRHCYTECYNNPTCLKRELKTQEVKDVLDKVYSSGVVWLFLTGGDPLNRGDFLDIYAYAKAKGFIITIFTNGYSMTDEIARCFEEMPPFAIEVTLNAVTEERYEQISQVKGSFRKVLNGIDLIVNKKLPLKIKALITSENLEEVPKIRKYVSKLGMKFRSNFELNPRLDGDRSPCDLRISPLEALDLRGKIKGCPSECDTQGDSPLFPCAIHSLDSFYVDPYGRIFLCRLMREQCFDLLRVDVRYALNELLPSVKDRRYLSDSKCSRCNLRRICQNCPGKAYLEKGDMEAPVEYYCRLARETEQRIMDYE